jgi:hypothetical protein
MFNLEACLVVLAATIIFFLAAAYGYDPQHGIIRKTRAGG